MSPGLREMGRPVAVAVAGIAIGVAGGSTVGASAPPADELRALEERVISLEWHRNLLLGLAGGTAIGLVSSWFLLMRKAGQLGRRHMERMVERFPGAVERVVQEHETAARLRRESRVLTVADGVGLQARLREHGFLELESIEPSAVGGEDLASADAVVFDLTDGVSPARAAEIIQSHPRDVYLAYSTARARVELPAGRTTFANSPITLYARLMELLEYHETRRRRG